MPSFNAPFIVNMKKLMNKQSTSWWYQPPWRARDVIIITILSIHIPILTHQFFPRAAMTLPPAGGLCPEIPMRDLLDFECDVTAYPYVTVIHHDREQRTFVNDYEPVVSENLRII